MVVCCCLSIVFDAGMVVAIYNKLSSTIIFCTERFEIARCYQKGKGCLKVIKQIANQRIVELRLIILHLSIWVLHYVNRLY